MKDIIKNLENSINSIYYQKYLRILAEINKYRMYTKSDLNIKSVMKKLKVPTKLIPLVMVGSSSVPLDVYNKIIESIRELREKDSPISYTSFVNIFKKNYATSSVSKDPIQSNIQMSQCYIAPNERYTTRNKPICF